MNQVQLLGRLTKDPAITTSGENKIARYTLAVDRRTKEKQADFISCVTFGRGADFAENYLHQGMKIAVSGSIRTGSYTNREGKKIYTTDVVVNEHEFCEALQAPQQSAVDSFITNTRSGDSGGILSGFEGIPEGQEELPFT